MQKVFDSEARASTAKSLVENPTDSVMVACPLNKIEMGQDDARLSWPCLSSYGVYSWRPLASHAALNPLQVVHISSKVQGIGFHGMFWLWPREDKGD